MRFILYGRWNPQRRRHASTVAPPNGLTPEAANKGAAVHWTRHVAYGLWLLMVKFWPPFTPVRHPPKPLTGPNAWGLPFQRPRPCAVELLKRAWEKTKRDTLRNHWQRSCYWAQKNCTDWRRPEDNTCTVSKHILHVFSLPPVLKFRGNTNVYYSFILRRKKDKPQPLWYIQVVFIPFIHIVTTESY